MPLLLLNTLLDVLAGVESFDINLEEKKVTIRGDVTPEMCIEKVSKMGKETSLWT